MMDAATDHSTINERLKAKVAAMTAKEREAFVELMYATDAPTPEMLDKFTLIMLGDSGPADAAEGYFLILLTE
jgi:hypothetical protein